MTAIVFDLDGTLIDSAPDLHAAGLKMLEAAGLPSVTLNQTRSFIGNGLPKLVERLARAAGEEPDANRTAELLASFRGFYDAEPALRTTVYPGASEALRSLAEAGCGLGICTNKPEAPARAILEVFGLADIFSVVVGGDTLPVKKPNPAPLELAYQQLEPAYRIFVGDSEVDAETAARAEVAFVLFTHGYRKSPVAEIHHDRAFSQHSELFGHVNDLRNRVA
ncbi:MAG: phosphoglycolate phosphatase [Pseudomonadota bacterium]